MTVDQYALCPCGNGKKIKFCKCKDSLPELDRIMTMLDGGQVVPALDRINRVLDEHPDAAWALAIKGRVLLDLREYDSLAENAERFVRLQPNNPLALTQRAASYVFRNQIEEATESVLEALTESGRQVDSFVLEIVSVLAYALANTGQFLSARAYATLALSAEGFEGGRTAASVLQELNTSPAVNHLLKALPATRPRPEGAVWAERFDEALGLLRSNRIGLAETKFASLARAYPGEPAILSGLLSCAVWRANGQSQSDSLAKLSECEQLDWIERSKLLAMSYLTEPKMPKLAVELRSMKTDIQDVSQTEIALQAHSLFAPIPERMLRGFVQNEDDVPPRSAFQVLDSEVPADDVTLTAENIPEAISVVLVYGKQTDRAARIEVPSVLPLFVEQVRQSLVAALGDLPLRDEVAFPVPFVLASEPRAAMLNRQSTRTEIDRLIRDFQASRLPGRIVAQAVGALGNRSLAEVASDDSVRMQREALMRTLENVEQLAQTAGVLESIRQAAGLQPLPTITVRTSDDVEEVDNPDLARTDCSELDAEGLAYLLQRAQLLDASVPLRRAATAALAREDSAEDVQLRASAYLALVDTTESADDALELLGQTKQFFEKWGLDKAQLLLMELPLRAKLGDSDGFQTVIRTLTADYRNREDVMAGLQQLLVSMGLINPDGSPRNEGPRSAMVAEGGASPAAQSSGIWTPDGGSAAPAAASSQGAGKLWVPGMD
jgi:tetratricopeptide (TPR) repeat protein